MLFAIFLPPPKTAKRGGPGRTPDAFLLAFLYSSGYTWGKHKAPKIAESRWSEEGGAVSGMGAFKMGKRNGRRRKSPKTGNFSHSVTVRFAAPSFAKEVVRKSPKTGNFSHSVTGRFAAPSFPTIPMPPSRRFSSTSQDERHGGDSGLA